jgi:hypothetical protein
MNRISQSFLAATLIAMLAACGANKADSNTAGSDKTSPQSMAKVALPDKTSTEAPENPSDEPAVKEVTIPAGTRLHIVLSDALSTQKNRPGDQFSASLAAPVVVEGETLLPEHTKIKGRVTDVAESGRVKGRASIRLVLTAIVHRGKQVPISTKPFVAVAQSTTKRDAAIIGGGTGLGALIGGIAGGGKGAAIGAAVGAGGGTGTVLATKGKELHYPPETKMSFTLAKPAVLETREASN